MRRYYLLDFPLTIYKSRVIVDYLEEHAWVNPPISFKAHWTF